ncbi:hypothetical protein IW262DRAFT_1461549 [Armillaria fumosa]|nr:hypothetical protein IW262DRAFT_1461549 [Armillaria fumosa]
MVIHNLLEDDIDIYSPVNAPTPTLTLGLNDHLGYPKQCAFGEERSRVLVCGDVNGSIHVFDAASGEHLQTLVHENSFGRIQTIATFSSPTNHLIASGETAPSSATICLWSKSVKRKRRRDRAEDLQMQTVVDHEARATTSAVVSRFQDSKMTDLLPISVFLIFVWACWDKIGAALWAGWRVVAMFIKDRL